MLIRADEVRKGDLIYHLAEWHYVEKAQKDPVWDFVLIKTLSGSEFYELPETTFRVRRNTQ